MTMSVDELSAFIVCAKKETLPGEADPNALGEEGWEMIGNTQHSGMTYFYVKRQTEK